MKYNDPIMNISIFETENVLTQASGGTPTGQQSAEEAVNAFIVNQTMGTTGGYKIVF